MNELIGKGDQNEVVVSFGSTIHFLDLIQQMSLGVTRLAGFDDDASYWIGLSVRESVTNAIRHGNQLDKTKKVGVRFNIASDGLFIVVSDQGNGFDESCLPDPLDANNLLKPSGRGIFYIRTFMDEVTFHNLPEGGFEVRMGKRLNHTKLGD